LGIAAVFSALLFVGGAAFPSRKRLTVFGCSNLFVIATLLSLFWLSDNGYEGRFFGPLMAGVVAYFAFLVTFAKFHQRKG
jgi:hypothetical protein